MASKILKHAASNELRRQSQQQQQLKYQERKNAVSSALKSQKSILNKKIVFNSDGEGDSVTEADIPPVDGFTESEPKVKLFDEENEIEDDDQEEEGMFEIKPQYEGTSGQKLLKIKNKAKGDKRFKLDERFAEEDQGEREVNGEEKQQLTDYKINQKFIGGTPFQGLRYDPSSKNHSQYEVQQTSKKLKRNKNNEEAEKDNEEAVEKLPEVSKDKFYEVSSTLADSFKTPKENMGLDTGFSLLKAFGKVELDDKLWESKEQPSVSNGRLSDWSGNNPFRYDSSEDEADNYDGTENNFHASYSLKNQTETSDTNRGAGEPRETFFFYPNDPKVQESLQFFCRTETKEKLYKDFQGYKHDLQKHSTKRRKDAIRRLNPANKKLAKMSTNKKSFSHHKFRRFSKFK